MCKIIFYTFSPVCISVFSSAQVFVFKGWQILFVSEWCHVWWYGKEIPCQVGVKMSSENEFVLADLGRWEVIVKLLGL